MRFVSLGLCTALALGCGDGDQSTLDPDYWNRGPGAGSRGDDDSAGGGETPGVGEPGGDDPGMTMQPALSMCEDESSAACSMDAPGDGAASGDRPVPGTGGPMPGAGGASGAGAASGGGSAGDTGSDAGGTAGTGSAEGGSGGSGGEDGDPGPLPDLVLDGAYLMATIQQDYVDASADQCLFNEGCVTGDGMRRVVRFGTRSANIGTADVVVGVPVAGNPLWEFDVCHEHFHFEGYARYDLIDPGTGVVLPIGNKNGFCLRDLDNWSNPSCATYDCDFQGISVGCADVYTPDLDCQWIDITDVAPGTYELLVTVNTERSIRELSYDNNSAQVTIEVAPETVRVVP